MSMKREQPERREHPPSTSASASKTPRQSALFIGSAEAAATPARTPVVVSPAVVSNAVAAPPASPALLTASASFVPASASGRQYLTADLRAATGLSRTAMDFYLRAGVIRPSTRTESGYLLFDEAELTVLREVIVWRTRGISLKDIKARLGREHAAERQ